MISAKLTPDKESLTSSDAKGSDPALEQQYIDYIKELLRQVNFHKAYEVPQQGLCFRSDDIQLLKDTFTHLNLEFTENNFGLTLNKQSFLRHYDDSKKQAFYSLLWLYLKTLPYNLDSYYRDMISAVEHEHFLAYSNEDRDALYGFVVFSFDSGVKTNTFPKINCSQWAHTHTGVVRYSDKGYWRDQNALFLGTLDQLRFTRLTILNEHQTRVHPVLGYFAPTVTSMNVFSGRSLAQLNNLHKIIGTNQNVMLNEMLSLFMPESIRDLVQSYYHDIHEEFKKILGVQIDFDGNCHLRLKDLVVAWNAIAEMPQSPLIASFEKDKRLFSSCLNHLQMLCDVYDVKEIRFKQATDWVITVNALDRHGKCGNANLEKALDDLDIQYWPTADGIEIDKLTLEKTLVRKEHYPQNIAPATMFKQPLLMQGVEYLAEIFSLYDLSCHFKYYQNGGLIFASEDLKKSEHVLNQLSIQCQMQLTEITVDVGSLYQHLLHIKKNLRNFMFACALADMPNFEHIYEQALQQFQNSQSNNLLNETIESLAWFYKYQTLNQSVDENDLGTRFLGFKFIAAANAKELPTCLRATTFSSSRDKIFERLYDGLDYHVPVNDGELDEIMLSSEIPHPQTIEQIDRKECHPSFLSNPSLVSTGKACIDFYELFHNRGYVKQDVIPSGKVLAQCTQLFPLRSFVSETIRNNVGVFISQAIIEMILNYLELPDIPLEVHQKLDALTDKEGNCELSLKDCYEICRMLPRKIKIMEEQGGERTGRVAVAYSPLLFQHSSQAKNASSESTIVSSESIIKVRS